MDHDTLRQLAAIADPIDRVLAISEAMDAQEDILRQAAKMRWQAVAAARDEGYRLDELATVLDVTPGRVSQMCKKARTRQ